MKKQEEQRGKNHRTGKLLAGFSIGLGSYYYLRKRLRGYAVKMIAMPPRQVGTETPAEFGLEYEEVWLKSRDNLKLHAWFIPSEQNKATIIFGHGFSDNKVPDLRHARWFHDGGYNVMMFDFRGHGRSEGPYGTSIGYMERYDVEGVVDYLLGRGERRIGYFGISMGAAVGIIAAAANPHISALLVDSPYAELSRSIAMEIRKRYRAPRWIARTLSRFAFASVAAHHGFKVDEAHPSHYIHRITPRPVFFIHGGADTLTEVENSMILYKMAGEPKYLWVEQGVEHTQVYNARPGDYTRRALEFFDKVDWEATQKLGDQARWLAFHPLEGVQ